MTSRRSFLKGGGTALAGARLIGTTAAAGAFLADAVPALAGAAKSVVIPTHEHWGDIEERLDLPASWHVQVQKMAGDGARALTRGEILQRIQSPIGSRTLREIAAGKQSAVITFDDLTRPTPTYDVAPLVVDELLAAGVPEGRIVFMGSYGTHRNLEADEVVRKLGRNLVRRFPWVNHNTWDNLVDVGTTPRKTRVRINQTFMAADLRVTISGIKAHGYVGYGGGPKAILPGVAALETVEYNHSALRPSGRRAEGVIPLFQSEMRLDMADAARLAKSDFSVQIVYSGRRKACGVFAGDIVDAHLAACRMAVSHYRTERLPQPDIVIYNSYPQSTQIGNYREWAGTARPGGTAVLVMQHPQGLSAWHYLDERTGGRKGRTYLDAMEAAPRPLPGDIQLIAYSQYMDKQHALKYPRNTLFAQTWEEALRHLQARHKGDASVAVYPCGPIQHSQTKLDEPAV